MEKKKTIILKHPDGEVNIEEMPNKKRRITVRLLRESLFMPRASCETFYPVELVRKTLMVKGPAYICDEILRDEDPLYVRFSLEKSILAYASWRSFENKRILDFGCGCGASTMNIARIFPKVQIVGIELDKELLSIAESRLIYYDFRNIKFIPSANPIELPEKIGEFDYVLLSAVYEHLLPAERMTLIPQIWSVLKPGGTLFLNQTYHRYTPIENHTTGLPFINYFPDKMALTFARRFSKRVRVDESWETLLRRGIRGADEREIIQLLRKKKAKPILLEPSKLGLRDRIDLWYLLSSSGGYSVIKFLSKLVFKVLKTLLGVTFVPYLSLAIKKESGYEPDKRTH